MTRPLKALAALPRFTTKLASGAPESMIGNFRHRLASSNSSDFVASATAQTIGGHLEED